ncbi:MAG: imidazoleglycerol-phosphate dehydratase HisB [Dehalococcoidia bacterium]
MALDSNRKAEQNRETSESQVKVSINLDGAANYSVSTGSKMLDHLLDQLGRHGGFDLNIVSKSSNDPDGHHVAEDTGIVLGRAFSEALGDRKGIKRMGNAIVPLDEALSMVAVDLGGRGYSVFDMDFSTSIIGDLRSELVTHVLESFAREAKINLHVRILTGSNDHHIAEATFKALAKSLNFAVQIDPRFNDITPSTKGTLTD